MVRTRYDDDDYPESLDEFGDRIKAELREEYTVTRNQEKFWDEFYGANPILRANRHIVHAVWQENIDQIMNSTAPSAMAFLAEESEKRIQWLEQTASQRREAAVMVGGPGFEGMSANEQRVEVPPTMGSVMNARKEARRNASRGYNMRQEPSNKPTYGRSA